MGLEVSKSQTFRVRYSRFIAIVYYEFQPQMLPAVITVACT